MQIITNQELSNVSGGISVYDLLGVDYQTQLINYGISTQELQTSALDASLSANIYASHGDASVNSFMEVAALSFADGLELGLSVANVVPS